MATIAAHLLRAGQSSPLIAALSISAFRRYWTAAFARSAADNLQMVALAILALDLTGSAARVMGLFMLGVTGLSPLSLGLDGIVADAAGARGTFAVAGAAMACAGAFALSRRRCRMAQ